MPDEPDGCDTADGRPATRTRALARLARMHGGDLELSSEADIREVALLAQENQLALIHAGLALVLARQPEPVQTVILSGSGEFLGRVVLEKEPNLTRATVKSLATILGTEVSAAACAHALAVLVLEKTKP